MKINSCFLLPVMLVAFLPVNPLCADGEPGDRPNGNDWTVLFDGSNLDQWTMGPDRSWVVEDGVISLRREFDGQEHNLDYLWTKEQFGDFMLELEYRVPERANSGVFLRTSDRKDPVYTGLELQVTNSFGQENLSRGGTVGSIYDLKAPTVNAAKPAGEWNTYRITCRGPMIIVEVNGQKVNEANLAEWSEPNRNPDGSKNKFPRRSRISRDAVTSDCKITAGRCPFEKFASGPWRIDLAAGVW